MKIQFNQLSFTITLLLAIPYVITEASAQQSSDQEEGRTVLEEVVVTAQRREESLQNVPVSVSAFTEKDIERRQIVNALDLGRHVPNLVASSNVGLPNATSFFLRGVGQDESIATSDPAVGTYVDGVYVARQVANNAYLYDIERIEVLRGPQGTLYGRNTSGGAVKIITRKPDEETRMEIQALVGNYERVDLKARISGAFSDTVFGSLATFVSEQDKGYQNNMTVGEKSWTQDSLGVRGQLRFVPTDNLDINLSAEFVNEKPTPPLPTNVINPLNSDDLYLINTGESASEQEVESNAFTLNIDWGVGGMQINSITAYRDLSQDYRMDISDDSVPKWILDTQADFKQFSQELQISSTAFHDKMNWVAGIFYMDEDNDSFLKDEVNLPPILVANFEKDLLNKAESLAIFGQATIDLTDKLALTYGGRWTREEKTVDVTATVFGVFPLFSTADLVAAGVDIAPEFKEYTNKLGVDYQVSENMLTYFSYTQGFKSGGWNARVFSASDFVNIDPETVDSIEIGLKSEWYDGKFRVNLAYFLADYEDFIVTAVSPVTGNFITVNAAEAQIDGFEMEVSLQIAAGLNVYGFAGLMDGEYKKLDPSVVIPKSNDIKRVPDLTYQIGLSYDQAMGQSARLGLDINFSYQDEYTNGFANSIYEAAPEQELLNLSLSYEMVDSGLKFSAGCSNCTNEEYFHSTLDFSVFGFASQYPGEPRRVYGSVTWKY